MEEIKKVPLLDLKRQYEDLKPAMMQAVERIFDAGSFILGPDVEAFENEIATYLGGKHAIAVSNGTDAIWLALRALGVKRGDRVLTSPFTFFATISAISNLGAEPVFADIDPLTFNLDVAAAAKVMSSQPVKALLPVHLYGQACEMNELKKLAVGYDIGVVEDAAQAIGTTYEGVKAGGLGDLGCFSFFPTKNLGAFGEGGLVTTNSDALAAKVKLLRVHGSERRYYHEIIGGNFRLDTLKAAGLRLCLPRLDGWIAQRMRAAAYYNDGLKDYSEAFVTPFQGHHSSHTFHQYTIRVKHGRRDSLQRHLTERGIGNSIYYPVPCHLQKALSHLGYQPGDFPVAEAAAAEVLSLPIFPELTTAEQDAVLASMRAWAEKGHSA